MSRTQLPANGEFGVMFGCSRSRVRTRRPFALFGDGHFPDSGVALGNQFAGTNGALLKIRSICGQELPARDVLTENGDGSHVWKIAAKAFVMIRRSSKPYAVVDWTRRLIAQRENDFFSDVNGRAAEQAASPRR